MVLACLPANPLRLHLLRTFQCLGKILKPLLHQLLVQAQEFLHNWLGPDLVLSLETMHSPVSTKDMYTTVDTNLSFYPSSLMKSKRGNVCCILFILSLAKKNTLLNIARKKT